MDGGVDLQYKLEGRGMVFVWFGRRSIGVCRYCKGRSALTASGSEASAFGQGMKGVFRLGAAKNWRPPDLSRYPTDEALRAAAGRTNPGMNAYGAGVAAAGAVGATCGCPK